MYVISAFLLTGCGNNQAGEEMGAQEFELLTIKQ